MTPSLHQESSTGHLEQRPFRCQRCCTRIFNFIPTCCNVAVQSALANPNVAMWLRKVPALLTRQPHVFCHSKALQKRLANGQTHAACPGACCARAAILMRPQSSIMTRTCGPAPAALRVRCCWRRPRALPNASGNDGAVALRSLELMSTHSTASCDLLRWFLALRGLCLGLCLRSWRRGALHMEVLLLG